MEVILAWAIANPQISVPLAMAILDIIAGWLPDRFTKWPGIILSAAEKAYNFGKEVEPVMDKVVEYKNNPNEMKNVLTETLNDPQAVAKIYQALVLHQKEAKTK